MISVHRLTRTIILSAAAGMFLLIAALSGCTAPQGTEIIPTSTEQIPSPTLVVQPTGTATLPPTEIIPTSSPTSPAATALTPEPTDDPANPDSWKDLPIIPETISDKMIALYKEGQQQGNNKRSFSKVGDCETSSEFFLKPFDMGPRNYILEPYTNLQELLNHFRGSFGRTSLAAKPSFSVSSVFSSVWSDATVCGNEKPISCEYRLHRPAFALIMFGTNDVHNSPEVFESNMRSLIEFSLKNHVIPILATKADNLEGDGRINATIARLAAEYEVPLWNFWRAMHELPDHGLKEDQVHFTYAPNNFNDPEAMKMGWPVRNLTALQVLDKVWRTVAEANGETY